jgi:hypothetical protein
MNAHPGETTDISGIDISNHARLRAMQRFGVIDRAAEYIRELLSKAEPVDVEYVTGGQAWKAGSITIVTDSDGEVVQTLFEREAGR